MAVIRKLVRDLNLPVQIFGEPTVRAADGLALSSRNGYLDEQQRAAAPAIYRTCGSSANASAPAPRTSRHCSPTPARPWNRPGCARLPGNPRADQPAPGVPGDRQLVILAAAYLGSTRLIDNLSVHLD